MTKQYPQIRSERIEWNSLPIYRRSGLLHQPALWHEEILHDEERHSMSETWMNHHAIWVTL